MNLENQVCSFEQSHRFREYFELETQWYWVEGVLDRRFLIHTDDLEDRYCQIGDENVHPAYSVAELGLLLGSRISAIYLEKDRGWYLGIEANRKYYRTEAIARATLLIWLIENDLINPGGLSL